MLTEWAERQAERRAEDDPRIIEARQQVEAVTAESAAMLERHEVERLALLAEELGAGYVKNDPVRARLTNPTWESQRAQMQALLVRHRIEELRGLSVITAAQRIKTEQEAIRRTEAARVRQVRQAFSRSQYPIDPQEITALRL